MPTLQIRNLPQDIYDKLKKMSEQARRSMTQQVVFYIEKGIKDEIALKESELRRKAALQRLDQLKKTKTYDTEEVVEWIRADRDS